MPDDRGTRRTKVEIRDHGIGIGMDELRVGRDQVACACAGEGAVERDVAIEGVRRRVVQGVDRLTAARDQHIVDDVDIA